MSLNYKRNYIYFIFLPRKGNLNRSTESTNHNETSSRSHGILQINVESKEKSDNL